MNEGTSSSFEYEKINQLCNKSFVKIHKSDSINKNGLGDDESNRFSCIYIFILIIINRYYLYCILNTFILNFICIALYIKS